MFNREVRHVPRFVARAAWYLRAVRRGRSFWVGEQEVEFESRLTHILYALKSGAPEPNRVQILRNHETAITKIGGKVSPSDFDR